MGGRAMDGGEDGGDALSVQGGGWIGEDGWVVVVEVVEVEVAMVSAYFLPCFSAR